MLEGVLGGKFSRVGDSDRELGLKIDLECVPCFLRQTLDAARMATDDVTVHERLTRDVLRLTAELDLSRPPPWVAKLIHERLRELTGVEDPYRAIKSRFNRLAMGVLPRLSDEVNGAADPLVAAAKLTIAANVIDLGITGDLTEEEVHAALNEASAAPTHGDWDAFRREVSAAKEILYLADNAGEIAIDRLLIEQLGPGRVTLAVRGRPVINDATRVDAREVGMYDLVEVIDNGSGVPGTVLDDCSAAFRERFERADLIVSKGQGGYETLSDVDANLFFLFKVKCPVIARYVDLPLGTHAVLQSRCRQAARSGGTPP